MAARSSVIGGLRRSASAIVGRPVSGSHVLRVDGYSHLRQMFAHGRHASSRKFAVAGHDWWLLLYPNGSHASSRKFAVAGHDWWLLLYPNGRHASSRKFAVAGHDWWLLLYPNGSHAGFKDHVSVLLQLASAPDAVVMARPRFSVLGRRGNPATAALPNDCGMHGFWHEDTWGARDLIDRAQLETSEEYLEDDCFAVQCDVDVLTARACPDDSAFSASKSLSVDHEPAV